MPNTIRINVEGVGVKRPTLASDPTRQLTHKAQTRLMQ
jgi:hypothetical protein